LNKDKEKMKADMAEQFKNAETIYRDKQGKRINIFKSIEDKKKELEQKNEARVRPIVIGELIDQRVEWRSGAEKGRAGKEEAAAKRC
jgi:hypothetical protein